MNFQSKYSGQFYKLKDGHCYTWRADGKFAYTGVYTGKVYVVQLTGYYMPGDDGTNMFQTTNGLWIRMNDGWENTGYSPIRHYTQKDAQYYVDKVIKANATILENNLFCARFANRLTEDEQSRLYQLQINLEERNNKLLSDGLCTGQKTSTPPGYTQLSNDLATFMQAHSYGSSIGALVSVSTIIVVAIVVASLATAAYFAYKYMAAEAEQDVAYSEELTKTLMAKLTPEEYEQLKQETRGIVTKAKLNAKFGSALSFLKWGLLAAAGLVVYNKLKGQ